ncbi:MAG: PKD repeat protein [Crocinitomicaceae bacterium]
MYTIENYLNTLKHDIMNRLLLTLIVVPFLGMMQANAQGCQADFVQDSSICPNVAFSDASTSIMPIVEWYWDFGDGTTSTSQNATHSYTMDGTFNVCLTTVSSDSCTSVVCQVVNINCIGGGSVCQANFGLDSSFCPNVNFLDLSTSQFPIVEWYWNFGDGNSSVSQNPSYTYSADGNYNVCLTTVSADSCVSTYCSTVNVNCLGGGGSTCQANFGLDSSICPNVNFIDLSTSQFSIVEWYWDFGDGNTSISQYPSHTYAANGNYNVCLTTVSSDSCTSTFCSTVNISCLGGGGAPCQASFTTTSYIDSLGGTVMYITNTSTVSPGMSYLWDFGDGNTSTDQYPTYTYPADGAYMLCLTISDSSCTSTYCDSIIVTGTQNGFTLVGAPAASASVENLELISGVQLYPNPTNHNLTLNMESAEATEIEVSIVNVTGQVVGYSTHQIGAGSNEIKLHTEELMKGYYFVKINTSISNVEAIRFIKN